jgi:hypothetical protein
MGSQSDVDSPLVPSKKLTNLQDFTGASAVSLQLGRLAAEEKFKSEAGR